MLLKNACSSIISIKVDLTFDDGRTKSRVISLFDFVDITYNKNGCIRRIEGKVIKISAEGADPKKWYIIVDGSEDFETTQARFSPANILDLEIIKKYDATQFIYSTNDYTNIQGLRIMKGRLQYTQNGKDWLPIFVDTRDIIKDAEYGPVGPIYPAEGGDICPPRPHHGHVNYEEDDGIKDAES